MSQMLQCRFSMTCRWVVRSNGARWRSPRANLSRTAWSAGLTEQARICTTMWTTRISDIIYSGSRQTTSSSSHIHSSLLSTIISAVKIRRLTLPQSGCFSCYYIFILSKSSCSLTLNVVKYFLQFIYISYFLSAFNFAFNLCWCAIKNVLTHSCHSLVKLSVECLRV